MGLIDRFTRDELSAKVWWPLALLLVVLLVATFRVQNQAAEQRRNEAAGWAVEVIRGPLSAAVPEGDSPQLSRDESDRVTDALAGSLGMDAVRAIRLWSADGTLLYSSDRADTVGSKEALNDTELQEATADPFGAVTVVADRSPTLEEIDPLLWTYAAVDGSSATVGQVEFVEGTLLADISSDWAVTRLVLFVSALIVLGLAGLSMREPKARIGAGVPFYPESVPPSMAVMDRDEEAMLRQAGAYARRKNDAVDARVTELEATKLRLEGELQRALSALAARTASAPTRVIPAAPVSTPPVSTPPPAPGVSAPAASTPPVAAPSRKDRRRDRKQRQPVAEPVVELRPEPRAEPVPEPTPRRSEEPTPEPRVEPAVVDPVVVELRPEPTPERSAPSEPDPKREPAPVTRLEPEIEPAAEPVKLRAVAEPQREPAPEPELTPEGERAAEPVLDEVVEVPEPEPAPLEPLMDLVILPEPEPEPEPQTQAEPVAARPANSVTSATPPGDARDVLTRLVAPVEPGERPPVDPGEIRARLARTAALKKPGSRERREEAERRNQGDS